MKKNSIARCGKFKIIFYSCLFTVFVLSIHHKVNADMLLWDLNSNDFEWIGESGISFSLKKGQYIDFIFISKEKKLIDNLKEFSVRYLRKNIKKIKENNNNSEFNERYKFFYFKDYSQWGFWNNISTGECGTDEEHFIIRSNKNDIVAIYGEYSIFWECRLYLEKSRFRNKENIDYLNIATWNLINDHKKRYKFYKQLFHAFLLDQGYSLRRVSDRKKIDSANAVSNKKGNFLALFRNDTTKLTLPVFDLTKDECTDWGEKPGNICRIYISDHFLRGQETFYVLKIPVRTCRDRDLGYCNSCDHLDTSKYKNACDYEYEVLKLTPEDLGQKHTNCLIANKELTGREKDDWKSIFDVDVLLYQKNKYPRKHLQILHHASAAKKVNAIVASKKLKTRYKNLETAKYEDMDCKYWLIFPEKD